MARILTNAVEKGKEFPNRKLTKLEKEAKNAKTFEEIQPVIVKLCRKLAKLKRGEL